MLGWYTFVCSIWWCTAESVLPCVRNSHILSWQAQFLDSLPNFWLVGKISKHWCEKYLVLPFLRYNCQMRHQEHAHMRRPLPRLPKFIHSHPTTSILRFAPSYSPHRIAIETGMSKHTRFPTSEMKLLKVHKSARILEESSCFGYSTFTLRTFSYKLIFTNWKQIHKH